MSAIDFQNVSIVFGKKPERALALADQGKTRDEISAMTGLVVGVSDATLSIEKGEILVLMGLSGSGKSTLLRAVNALAPVVRGEVKVDSNGVLANPYTCSAQELRDLRMHSVSMVFQQFGLLPWRSVAENVGFGLELAGVSEDRRKIAVAEQLELVNLGRWSERKVQELSGGMQQRVGLARAFATGAPILLMDEPFSALDPLIRTRLQDELLEFQRRLKKTILFVSHDLDEAFRIGNRVAIMEGGRIVQCGTPQDIVRNPVNQYVSDFVQNMNPINMLTASDVMGAPDAAHAQDRIAGTLPSYTQLSQVLDMISKTPGKIIVSDGGLLVGEITPQRIVAGLTRHRPIPVQTRG